MISSSSYFLEDYLEKGFSQIIVVDQDSKEEKGFHATEYEDETAVARKGQQYFLLSGSRKTQFGPKGANRLDVTFKEIGAQKYLELGQSRAIIDTAEKHEEFGKLQESRALAAELTKKLDSMAPKCPIHDKTMENRASKKTHFWGCPKYPNCNEVKWMTPAQKQICAQLDKLPQPRYGVKV